MQGGEGEGEEIEKGKGEKEGLRDEVESCPFASECTVDQTGD